MDAASPGALEAIFGVTQMFQLLLSFVLGFRLFWLATSSRQLPEFLLGLSFVVGSGVGFAILVSGMIALGDPSIPKTEAAIRIGLGYGLLDIGVVANLGFNYVVYRRKTLVGRLLFFGLAILLLGAYANFGLRDAFLFEIVPTLNWYWVHYCVIAMCTTWGIVEAFRYYALMRKRLNLGIGDPILADRFRLFGAAGLCGIAILTMGALPSFTTGLSLEAQKVISDLSMIAMSLLAMISMIAYWLTFFPVAIYRRYVERREARFAGLMEEG